MGVFPLQDRPRLWGVAVSHYQVEGGDPCDWTAWEAAGRTKGGACGRAAGSWERYEEDAGLAAAAGANAFRFSVSWSRIEPARGTYDDAALARYGRLVDRLLALGLEPVVTLHHYTHPAWFHAETPWTSPAAVDAFARFSRRVAGALAPRVRVWITLNEPLVLLLGGYLDGQIPPGLADGRAANLALGNLLAAHAAAAAAIHDVIAARRRRPRAQHDGLRPGAAGLAARPAARRSRAPPVQRRLPGGVRERGVGPLDPPVHAPERPPSLAPELPRLRRRELLLAPSRRVPRARRAS